MLSLPNVATEAALVAARRAEPLLQTAGRSWERLDVNEQIAGLQSEPEAKAAALMAAAQLATELGENGRAIVSLEARLEIGDDADALDAIIVLLEREQHWPELIGCLGRRAVSDRTDALRRQDLVRIARASSRTSSTTHSASILAWRHVDERFGETDESADALASLLAGVAR